MPFTERLAEATYRDEHWNVRAQVQDFQTIDEDLPVEDRPYARTPRVLASGDWDLGLGAIDYGFDAEFVNFERNHRRHRLAHGRGAARRLRLVGAGIFRASRRPAIATRSTR